MDAREVLHSVAAAYSRLESLEGDFTLVSSQQDRGYKMLTEHPLQFAYSSPNKVRIEHYPHRHQHLVVSDGALIHSCFDTPPHKRYTRGALTPEHIPGVFDPMHVNGHDPTPLFPRIAEHVVSAAIAGEETIRIEGMDFPCTIVDVTYEAGPAGGYGPSISPIRFWCDGRSLVLRRDVDVTVSFPHENGHSVTTHHSLRTRRLSVNSDLPASTFTFVPPEGVEVTPDAVRGSGGISMGGGSGFRDPTRGVEFQSNHTWEGEVFVEREQWKFRGRPIGFERRWRMAGPDELEIVERIRGPKGELERAASIPLD